MSSLAHLQDAVFQAVFGPGTFAGVPDLVGPSAKFARAVAVHRETCRATLQSALSTSFPTLHATLGAEAFAQLAADYVAQHAPRSAWLEDYGRDFPAFVEQRQAGSPSDIGDIGRIDAAVNFALHADADLAPGPTIHPLSTLGNVAERDLTAVRLIVHPASQLLEASWHAASTWSQIALGEPWPGCDAPRARLDLLASRAGSGVVGEPIPVGPLALLLRLQRGASLGDAFARHGADLGPHLEWLIGRSVFAAWTRSFTPEALENDRR